MRKTIKKGFTLVELLITIAIIAILSVVAIVGYVSFTTKARISNDTTIVTELNRVLQAEHVNKTPNTMQEIVDEIKDAGFILTRLTPTASKHHIVYDKESDRFYLVNDQMTIVGGQFDGQHLNDKTWYHWKVVQSYNDVLDPNFSYYLGEMKDDEPIEGITVCNGIDVGENEVKKIKYENTTPVKDDVVIRTNGGTLEIDTPDDTIKHYGEVSVLNITEVGKSSYHEYGYAPFAQIKAGRVINEVYVKDEAGIQNLFLIAKDSSSFDEIVVGAAPGKSLPTLDRTEVTIGDGVKVCEVQTGVTSSSTASNEFIWLFGDGTIESQRVVVTTSTSKPDVETGEVSEETSSGKAAIELANVSNEEKATPSDVETGVTLYDGGAGTEKSPYLISEGSQFKNITNKLADKNFTLINDIDVVVSDFTDSALIPTYYGTFDGGNYRIRFPHQESEQKLCFVDSLQGDIQNIEFEFDNYGYIAYSADSNVTLTGVDVYGLITCTSNYGAYILEDNANHISLVDCDFYGTIVSGGANTNNNAIYVGWIEGLSAAEPVDRRISFDECINYGSISSGEATMFIAGSRKTDDIGSRAYITIDVNNCLNNGLVEWIDGSGYRPYNHFMASNIQETKEINLNGVKYLKTVNLNEEQISALGINGTTIKEMDQQNATNPSDVAWTGTRLYKHNSPTMPDSNGRNYTVAIADPTLKIYVDDDGTFGVIKATSSVSYYEVTDKTMVHYNGSSMLYIITERIESNQFVDNKYKTTMKNYTFVDERLISKTSSLQGGEYGVITINDVDYPTYTVNNETHYYFTDENYYFAADMYKNKVGTVYVSAYDSNGRIVASASLSEKPNDIIDLVKTAKLGNDLSSLFVPNKTGNATWRSDRYANTSTDNSVDRYLGSQYNYNLYACGFIEIFADNSGNAPLYYLKTKTTLSGDHKGYERILLAKANGNIVEIVGTYKELYKINGIIEGRETSGDYYIYELNLNDIFSTIDFSDSNERYFFRVSISASGGNQSMIYSL